MNQFSGYLIVLVVSAGITFGFAHLARRVGVKYGLHPPIRERDVHQTPTPRLGGVAMFIGILVAFGVAWQLPFFDLVFADPEPVLAILGAALFIVGIGVADDLWDLDWMIKLAAQFMAAGLVAWLGVQIYSLPIGGLTVGSSWVSFSMTVFAIVLVMNAINFVDGLDGLVAGVAVIANTVFFVYTQLLVTSTGASDYFNLASLIAAILVGACLGFLPLNWHPARLFMGDAGALLVGLLMATSAAAVTGQVDPAALGRTQLLPAFIPILLPFAILVVPLADFVLAVLRRLRAGKSPFSADRMHLHHRLLDLGHSQVHAVLIFYGWTVVISVGCLAFFAAPTWLAVLFVSVGVVTCTAFTLLPIGRRRRADRLAQRVAAGAEGAPGSALYDRLDEASGQRDPEAPVSGATLDTLDSLAKKDQHP
ncbi:undecaprenyl-phosphate alpha-N-acetylglucosaminyl 1-phosphate transferase [Plantibacter sp. H53]|uniref:MraY family glycosyltransferase n=1 Tax=unclassified Plantibacter TaxID=2624265 RepID=UPI0007D8D639|nr:MULTISPECIES: MraY family glycosyltransferase [unclassified Plantibacter]OAN33276.1 undecaprenyl-phosphate alpha-N-acetylglucosaminyl 1-phosphate transferase [Plantibacter sp. H53]OII36414.1 undecaprenyl-phosphate alpha-N-acetylglucosaminyl 1-phosphate transferase [Plantibacter sp. MMLR14_011]